MFKMILQMFENILLPTILTRDNGTLVGNHANPYSMAIALYALQQARILTEANRTLVANHANPFCLGSALSELQQVEILTQMNFDLLIAPNHAALIREDARINIWHRIPHHLLTQANFERLVMASEQANPIAAFQGALNQILGAQAQVQAGHAAAFNPGQSTHTASVHRSVSASASRLMTSYGEFKFRSED